ncbi:MAG: DUF3386 domain-containing protein [Leptolyngbyaceae bacterium]|nr:DUF3386 domain-containing protein [Leptolyngbyaceae bacterium]
MNTTETIQNIDASALFRSAYENRYTWDANFPGFTAVAHSVQNDLVYQADVHVASDLKITITNANSSEAEAAIRNQISEIVIHRVRRRFEDVHGKNVFTCGDRDASGVVTVLVDGAAAGDQYKVHNNIVSMVHRHIHGTVVTINVLSTLDTGKGYLPVNYESFYSHPETGEPSSPTQQHHDEYALFGEHYILTLRRVMTGDSCHEAQTQEFQLTEISLLEHNPSNS